MSEKRIPAPIIVALKRALASIYWYKADLKGFITASVTKTTVLSAINWNNNKIDICAQLIDRMEQSQDFFYDDLLRMIQNACSFNDFSHFDKLDNKDAKRYKENAQGNVKALREQCKGCSFANDDKDKEARKKEYNSKQKHTQDYIAELADFKNKYYDLIGIENAQSRGFKFEAFIDELFYFFELSPRSAYKINGEQIDGAFTHDNHDYLLEAKWQTDLVEIKDVDIFEMKISRKLKNVLGLFISMSGFVANIEAQGQNQKSVIMMDSQDLIQVLENRIALDELIRRKRRHASETGERLYRVSC